MKVIADCEKIDRFFDHDTITTIKYFNITITTIKYFNIDGIQWNAGDYSSYEDDWDYYVFQKFLRDYIKIYWKES